jgi:hypothetical protein
MANAPTLLLREEGGQIVTKGFFNGISPWQSNDIWILTDLIQEEMISSNPSIPFRRYFEPAAINRPLRGTKLL